LNSNKTDELNEIIPIKNLKAIYYVYYADDQDDLNNLINLKKEFLYQNLQGIIFEFDSAFLNILCNPNTDEIYFEVENHLKYPPNTIFKIREHSYASINATKMKLWRKYLNKTCDWIWILTNTSHYTDGIQFSFFDLEERLQLLAWTELKILELKSPV